MLQIVQSLPTEAVTVRAQACLDAILEVLGRLDSKAPEALYREKDLSQMPSHGEVLQMDPATV